MLPFIAAADYLGPFAIIAGLPYILFVSYYYRKSKVLKLNRTISSSGKTKEEFRDELKEFYSARYDYFFLSTNKSDDELKRFIENLYDYANETGYEVVIKQCDAPDDTHPDTDGIYMDINHCWEIKDGKKIIHHTNS